MIANCASIYGAYMYPSSAAPRFIAAGSGLAVVSLMVGALAIGLRYIHKWENKKLERVDAEMIGSQTAGVNDGQGAGRRAPGFRYIY
jgi:hypothetical protein